jgi:transposase
VEISSISIDDNPQYGPKLVQLLKSVMDIISEQLPLSVNIALNYANGSNDDQKFVSNFAQLLGTFLKEHPKLVEVLSSHPDEEQKAIMQAHLLALRYLLQISQVEDVEVFKVKIKIKLDFSFLNLHSDLSRLLELAMLRAFPRITLRT